MIAPCIGPHMLFPGDRRARVQDHALRHAGNDLAGDADTPSTGWAER